MQKVESDEEAVRLANDTPFGLSVITSPKMSRGTKIAEALDYGIIGWNHGTFSCQAPFGGMKQSGLGVKVERKASNHSWKKSISRLVLNNVYYRDRLQVIYCKRGPKFK